MDNRRDVRSFDLFDTLIARRCVEPHNIFRIVETKTGHHRYAETRVEAEVRISGSPYTLDDIYSEMCKVFALPHDKARVLKDAELAVELENIFPIREHCAEVQVGDLIISDTYLPEYFLRQILTDVCELPFASPILSSHGKRAGVVWRSLEQHFTIRSHLGDNPATDLISPRQNNVRARQTTVSLRTSREKLLAEHGLEWLAHLVREARLTTWDLTRETRQFQLAQIEHNFPLLFLASLCLLNAAEEKNWDVILFSSRDCYLWSKLFGAISQALNSKVKSKYFYTSRIAKANASAKYIEYFNAIRAGQRTVIADVCGTGWSSRRLIEQSGGPPTDIFLIHRINNPNLEHQYEQIATASKAVTVYSLPVTGDNNVLEMLNCAGHPMVEDVIAVSGHFLPSFSNVVHDARLKAIIDIHNNAFMHAASMASTITKTDYSRMLSNLNAGIVQEIYSHMSQLRPMMSDFFEHQSREESQVWKLLRKDTQTA